MQSCHLVINAIPLAMRLCVDAITMRYNRNIIQGTKVDPNICRMRVQCASERARFRTVNSVKNKVSTRVDFCVLFGDILERNLRWLKYKKSIKVINREDTNNTLLNKKVDDLSVPTSRRSICMLATCRVMLAILLLGRRTNGQDIILIGKGTCRRTQIRVTSTNHRSISSTAPGNNSLNSTAQIAADNNGSDGVTAARDEHDETANDDVNIYIHLKLQLRLVRPHRSIKLSPAKLTPHAFAFAFSRIDWCRRRAWRHPSRTNYAR